MQRIDDYINKAHHLVPAPHILPQLMPYLNNPESDNSKVVEVISYDPSLTASVLRVCNSAFYSHGTSIDNLLQAVNRLGSLEVYRIVVAVTGAVTLSQGKKGQGIEATVLWAHSVATAVCAQSVAKDLGDDENKAFTAGLLHDVGKIILASAMEKPYDTLFVEASDSVALVGIERKQFGCDHAEVGGRLLEKWKFPAYMVAAIRFHHNPSVAKPHERLAACVYLGDSLAYFMGYGYGRHTQSLKDRDAVLAILNISPQQLPNYVEQCFATLKSVKALYKLES